MELRKLFLLRPDLTLAKVAKALGITRQRVSLLVGPLGRPNCATHPDHPAPKRDQAAKLLPILEARVRQGEAAEHVAAELGISLTMAMSLGFRTHSVRPSHGTQARAAQGCNCWRCRRAAGIALPRGPRSGIEVRVRVLDWCAWSDPDTEEKLTQAAVARLAGTTQPVVSRISRLETR